MANKLVTVKAVRGYRDIQLSRKIKNGETFEVSDKRARELESRGLVSRLQISEETNAKQPSGVEIDAQVQAQQDNRPEVQEDPSSQEEVDAKAQELADDKSEVPEDPSTQEEVDAEAQERADDKTEVPEDPSTQREVDNVVQSQQDEPIIEGKSKKSKSKKAKK
jgi:small-conductance mechanosensitive channel